jgi:hypothetical protein
MTSKLNQEEKEILKSYDADEWVSVSKPADMARYKLTAKNTLKKISV